MKRVIVAGGGTGGHIYPGVSIARAIQKKDPQIDVQFVGATGGLEESLVPKEGFVLNVLPIGPLNRSAGIKKQIMTLLMMPVSLLKAAVLVLRLRPSLVIGVGGYASAPFVLMSAIFGKTCVLFEPNAYPGMANRWLARFVNANLVVFEQARKLLKGRNFESVGLPVRQEIVSRSQKISRATSIDSARPMRILIFGGSQGARRINQVILEAVSTGRDWLKDVEFVHQIGRLDYASVHEHYEKLRKMFPWLKVEDHEFLFDMPERYAWADLVICRAGASTVAELICMKKPALFIPLPTAADDHQTANANSLVSVGAALLCPQSELSAERLEKEIHKLRSNPSSLVNMAEALGRLQIPNAADKIAEICLSFIESRDSQS